MLSSKKLNSSAKNTVEYMKTTEYYRDEKGNDILPRARWFGEGVDEFDLNNPERDANEDFERLLLGLHPDTGKELSNNSGGNKDNRTMGIDLTFSAEKAFSIQIALEGSERQREIGSVHQQAVEHALRYISEELTARTGKAGNGPAVATSLIYRQVTHLDSREGDPQLHTHNVLIASSKCADGSYRQVDLRPLMSQGGPLMKSAGAVYRSAMAHGMRNLGYQVEQERALDADGRELGEVWHHMKEISKGEESLLSKRRTEILQAVKEAEEDNSKISIGFQEATQRTRQDKNKELTIGEICENAKRQIVEYRSNEQTLEEKRSKFTVKSEEELLESLHIHNSYFTRHDYIRAFSQEFDVEKPAEQANIKFQLLIESGVIVQGRDDEKGNNRFYSKSQFEKEKTIVDSAMNRNKELQMRLTPQQAEESISRTEIRQRFKFTQEQRNASKFVMCDSGGVACVDGWAGTGKTATAGAYIDGFQKAGRTVYGTSTSAKAAKKLESEINNGKEKAENVECFSCAKLLSQLKNGLTKFDQNSVLIVDEAGMVGANTMRELQIAIDKAGGKMVLLGDALQLQPIESGRAFDEIKHVIGEAKQTEIRRQKNENDLALAKKFYSGAKGETIIQELKSNKQLDISNDPISRLVTDFYNNPKSDKMILVQNHIDGDAITKELRNLLKQNGQLKSEFYNQEITKQKGTKRNLEIALGEKIRFKKNASWLGVTNGDEGEVVGFKETKNGLQIQIKLQSDIEETNGKSVLVPMWKYDRIEHAYTNTVHSAQGQGKDDIYCLMRAGEFLDRSMAMVSFTRTKENFKAYATEKDENRLADHLDSWGKKETTQDIAKRGLDERTAEEWGEVAQRAKERSKRTGGFMEPKADTQQAQQNLEMEQKQVLRVNNNSQSQSSLAVDKSTKNQEERERKIIQLASNGVDLMQNIRSNNAWLERGCKDKYELNLIAYVNLIAPKIVEDKAVVARLESVWQKERGQEEIDSNKRYEKQKIVVYGDKNENKGTRQALQIAVENKRIVENEREQLTSKITEYEKHIKTMDGKYKECEMKIRSWSNDYKKPFFGSNLSQDLKDFMSVQLEQFQKSYSKNAEKTFEYLKTNTLSFPKELNKVPATIKEAALDWLKSGEKIDITKNEIEKRNARLVQIDKYDLPELNKAVNEKELIHRSANELLEKNRRFVNDLEQMKYDQTHPAELQRNKERVEHAKRFDEKINKTFNQITLQNNQLQLQEQQQHEQQQTRRGPRLSM